MLQSIQKKLLLKYPLIWNTKFVPMLFFGILLHAIFFVLGYIDGTIDFSNKNNIDIQVEATLFGILVVILAIILWLIFYFKNNALKSFYHKTEGSLFYEFLQVLIICSLLTTFYLPFSIAKQLHQRSYYSLEETQKRCKIISTAEIFIDGNFKKTEIDSLASGLIDSLGNLTEKGKKTKNNYEDYAAVATEYIENDVAISYKDYIIFNGKKYDEYSLLNRGIYEFSVSTRENDSINEIEVKNWLFNDDRNAVEKLLKDYRSILHEHNLETNMSLNKWLEAVYNYPDFKNFLYIYPFKKEYETDYSYSRNNSVTIGDYDYRDKSKYSKYFIQQDVLKTKYNIVSEAHTDDFIDAEALLSLLYVALAITILIFSFRVTSGKSWLISIVVVGVINLFAGIFAAITSSEQLYLYTILTIIICGNIYYFAIYSQKETLKLSRIALNIIMWANPFVIPFIYFIIQDYYRNRIIDKFDLYSYGYNSPEYLWMREHHFHMLIVNYLLIILTYFFISRIIRNWKGIAEN